MSMPFVPAKAPPYNPEQLEMIDHDKGPMLTAAVAGAGKTEAVVARIIALIVKGVPPQRILAATFSRKAATDMNLRLARRLGPRSGARVGTFHSVALEILRAEIPEYAEWEVADGKYRMCLKQAVGWQEMEWKEADVTVLEGFISRCLCDLSLPGDDHTRVLAERLYAKRRRPDSIPSKLVQAYTRAEEIRKEKHLLTFDAMMAEAVLLLRDHEDVRARWASRWDYVITDEGQDSNLCQLELGALLSRDHRNINAVGDPAQTIYSWRGAHPEELVQFDVRWPGARIVKMNRNYRCGRVIIAVANKVLRAMDPKTRLPMEMIAERGVEGSVGVTRYLDFDAEARAIATRIDVERVDGRPLKGYAVLYRTQAQSRALEEAFLGARIPYVIQNGCNFYERSEVSDLLSYLRIASGGGTSEDVTRCLNKPFRFLGKAFLARVEAAAGDFQNMGAGWTSTVRGVTQGPGLQGRQIAAAVGWCDLIDEVGRRLRAWDPDALTNSATNDGSPAGLLELITTRTGYTDWLRREEGDETTENSRVSNVRELVRVATKFRRVSEFLGFVDQTIAAARAAAKANETIDAVTLTTIHSSKGLEWPVVHLIGVNADILPHARAEDPEEERRLFYVAVTRARDELHLSCVQTAVVGGKVRQMSASPFLIEAELTIVEAGDPPGAPDAIDPAALAAGEAEVQAIEGGHT